MTSFVAWLGVDSRGPTSIYFASDSRLSWGNDPRTWDSGRKLFACHSSPEMFGFTGYLLLPQSILTRVSDLIDRGLLPQLEDVSPIQRVEELAEITRLEVAAHRFPFADNFSLFYAARSGEGMSPKSVFHLYEVHCDAPTRTVRVFSIDMPHASSILLTHGTGKVAINEWTERWQRSDQGGTSRAVFSAFCDALRSGKDPGSGGEPQLVGLYRQDPAKMFGVVSSRGASVQGMLGLTFRSSVQLEWRDELFQRVHANGSLVKSAQLHASVKFPPI